MTGEDRQSLTVSQLNGFIQDVIRAGFSEAVWVCGEIQGYDRSRSKKHVFFDLCEKDPLTQDVMARIGLVIFSGKKFFLEKILEESGRPFALKDDIEVRFLCQVDFYPPHGAMRLIVESIDPSYTLGKIAAEKQRLIAFLKKNGTFEKNKQLVMPRVPLRIGLITSYDSAAYNDFLSELSASGFGFQVICRNTLMQGKGAQDDVCAALETFYDHPERVDVIVITRGGGSISDLSCFDSRRIAETVARSPVPVLSGIGHEIDMTVTDLAAFLYEKTPTAAARYFVLRIEQALEDLERAAADVFLMSAQYLADENSALRQAALDFQHGIRSFLKAHERRIIEMEHVVQREPLRLLDSRAREADDRMGALKHACQDFFKAEETRIAHCRRLIEASSPEKIFRRGFSITRAANGLVVRSLGDTHAGQTITTQLADGCLQSVVDQLIPEEHPWQN